MDVGINDDLHKAKSEEDVKDAYIKALGLKSYSKNIIDIQTKEVWFEAKANGSWTFYEMFTQLLHYVQVALNKDEHVPALLCVIDTEKAALMQSSHVIPFLARKTIKVCAVSAPLILRLQPACLPLGLGTVSSSGSPGRGHFEGMRRCV